MQLWAIIVDSFRESLDRKFFWLIVVLSLLVAIGLLSIGFAPDHVSLMFGNMKFETDYYNSSTELGQSRIIGIVIALMSFFLGWIGVLLMIIATAGFFPAFMERGVIDVVLAKPISRPRLFLYKYLSSMVFVLLQATFFVGLTFLVMGLRWGVWVPKYLIVIPLLVLLFSYIYCVTVFVGVATRSTVAAILLSIGAWVVFAVPSMALDQFEATPELKQKESLYRSVRVMNWVLPKTSDIPYIATKFTKAGAGLDIMPQGAWDDLSAQDRAELRKAQAAEEKRVQVDPIYSVGSSLAFEIVVVLLAMFKFARRDF